MDRELSGAQKTGLVVVGELVLWGLILSLAYWLGFPGNGLFAAIAIVISLLPPAAWYYIRDTGSMQNFQAKKKDQLSNVEATELAWYYVRKYKGYRVEQVIGDGDVPEINDFEEKDEARRIFKFEFSPLNVSGRACLYLVLDQELSVDKDDTVSLKQAAEEIKSARMVRSWQVMDYEAKKKEAREKLGMTSTPEVFVKQGEGDEGAEILSRRQLSEYGESTDED